MRVDTKVTVFLHSDAVTPDCNCGERAWEVQLPSGWMWRDSAGPALGGTLAAVSAYAHSLYPNHPDVTRSEQPDRWDYPYAYPEEPEVVA